ncbi:MAG: ABC transporter substrate-binding protein [Burkholderiaceae bacterium]|nr:ABC transporter substrate-binding protein [Burkholderiaceae bacterium]
MIRKTTAIGRSAALALLLAAPLAAQAGKSDDTLNVAFDRELESIDSYMNTAREGIVVTRLVWDSLLYRDPKTNEYLPNLATAYKWVDATTMEFDLRQGVKFHNGEKFDADDVVFTINWVANPANGVKTQSNVNWLASAEKLGEYKVRVKLKAPFPAALEFLSGPVVMYPNEYYAKVGPKGMSDKPVGTGPYKVASVEQGKRFVFVRNDGYFAGSPKGKANIGKIVVRTIAESNTQLAELLSGGLDWIWKVKPDQAAKLAGTGRFTVKNSTTMRIGYLSFDAAARTGKGPMQNPKVREAIAHAIDREGIVKALVKGESVVVHSACFPSQFGCTQDVKRYKYDPALAKKLMAEAGYPDGFEIPFFAYRNRDFAEAMINNLKAIGIRTKFSYLKYAALRDKVRAGEVPFQFMTWGSYSINDASAITSQFFGGTGDDVSRDSEVIAWLKAADTSIDPAVRKENYGKALKKIAEKVYWLPLWSYNTNYAFTPEVDFTPTADEIPRFFTARWK